MAKLPAILKSMQEIVNFMADYYTKRIKASCSVTLKITTYGNLRKNLNVATLIRDATSSGKYSELDKLKARLFDNTPYSFIFNSAIPQMPVFISNDLTKDRDYQSSQFEFYGGAGMKGSWAFSYKSLIVAPVVMPHGSKTTIPTLAGY